MQAADAYFGKSTFYACATGTREIKMTAMRPDMMGSHELTLPEGNYGIPETMMHGFQNARSGNSAVHPLEYSEKHWHENKMKMEMSMLRNMQGLHAPLKLQMERNVCKKMRRLPGLPSSNILEDSLTGRDLLIGFEDVLNVPEERESTMNAHIQIEKDLKIL